MARGVSGFNNGLSTRVFTALVATESPPKKEGEGGISAPETEVLVAGAGAGAGDELRSASTIKIFSKYTIDLLNSYYDLGKESEDYDSAELLEHFRNWKLRDASPEEYEKLSPEEVKRDVKNTIDAIVRFLDERGINSSRYKEGSIFYRKMTGGLADDDSHTGIESESHLSEVNSLYRSKFITTFMKEALVFVNILSRQPDASIKNSLSQFPPVDDEQYRRLSKLRNAQMNAYMPLKSKEMPWMDRTLSDCHRDFVKEHCKGVPMDPAYRPQLFSAIEHLLGVGIKEEDTLLAMQQIPANIACRILHDYAPQMKTKITKRRLKDQKDAIHAIEIANRDKFRPEEIREVFYNFGFSDINGILIEEYLADSATGTWSAEKAATLFPEIEFIDSVTLTRPYDFTNQEHEPKSLGLLSTPEERVPNLVLSDNEDECNAGLQALLLVRTNLGGSSRQFVNFIRIIGKSLLANKTTRHFGDRSPAAIADAEESIAEGINFLKSKSESNSIAKEIFDSYSKITDGASIESDIGEIRRSPAKYLDTLIDNEKVAILENLFHNQHLFTALSALINKSTSLDEDKLVILGAKLAYLGAKFNAPEVIEYVASGFTHHEVSDDESYPHLSQRMLLEGLFLCEKTVDGEIVSGLEHLVENHPEMFCSRILGDISLFLRPALPNGQNIFHRLASKGDIGSIDIIMNPRWDIFSDEFKRDICTELDKSGKTAQDLMDELNKNDENSIFRKIFLQKTRDGKEIFNPEFKKVFSAASEYKDLVSGKEVLIKRSLLDSFTESLEASVTGDLLYNVDRFGFDFTNALLNIRENKTKVFTAEFKASLSQQRDASGKTPLDLAIENAKKNPSKFYAVAYCISFDNSRSLSNPVELLEYFANRDTFNEDGVGLSIDAIITNSFIRAQEDLENKLDNFRKFKKILELDIGEENKLKLQKLIESYREELLSSPELLPFLTHELPCIQASMEKNSLAVILLIETGKSSIEEKKGYNDYSVLHYAAISGDQNLVRYLIKKGADANYAAISKSRTIVTPLAIAVRNNNEDLVRILLQAGAKPPSLLESGEINLAEFNNLEERDHSRIKPAITRMLKNAASALSAEPVVTSTEKESEISGLPAGAPTLPPAIDTTDKFTPSSMGEALGFGISPFTARAGQTAAKASNIRRASVAKSTPSEEVLPSYSSLHRAVAGGNETLVISLIEGGANVNQVALSKSKTIVTPLAIAVRNNNEDLVRILLQAGAKPPSLLDSGEINLAEFNNLEKSDHSRIKPAITKMLKEANQQGVAAPSTGAAAGTSSEPAGLEFTAISPLVSAAGRAAARAPSRTPRVGDTPRLSLAATAPQHKR